MSRVCQTMLETSQGLQNQEINCTEREADRLQLRWICIFSIKRSNNRDHVVLELSVRLSVYPPF